jgi:ketosteroid isomerase-like protein
MLHRVWLAQLIGCLSVTVATAAAARAADETADAVAGVNAVLKRQESDWNRGDLDAFLDGYWHSPKVVFQSGGQRIDGWEAMRNRYRRRYQLAGRAMGQLEFSSLDIEPLSSDAALVRGGWRLTMPDGKKPGGLFTLIFRKLPEGWKIVHDHTSSEEPSPAQPADQPSRH